MACGIYCILNKVDGKRYIGQSIDIDTRKNHHFGDLRRGEHKNSYLQHSFNKYGENSFVFSILEYCSSKDELNEREKYWISFYDTTNRSKGYNLTTGGDANTEFTIERRMNISNSLKGNKHPMYGKHHSKETRKKMSKSRKGERNGMYGKHHSKETKQKISKAHKGKNNGLFGENHPMYGKSLSEETRNKISDAIKGENHPMYGKHHSEEVKRKISEINKGRIHSIESRINMSSSQNTTGYFRVCIRKDKTCKYGFKYAYQYYGDDDKRKAISRVDINELKKEVISNGLPWYENENINNIDKKGGFNKLVKLIENDLSIGEVADEFDISVLKLEEYLNARFTSFSEIKSKKEYKRPSPAQQKVIDAGGLDYISSKIANGWSRKEVAEDIGVGTDAITLFLKNNDTSWKELKNNLKL